MEYLIIEDEVPAQRFLSHLLHEIRPTWKETACLDSVESAVLWLNNHPSPDVIFMDIQLSDGLAFDILKEIEIEGMIIFTTAYDEYAIRAFKVNSIDYLLKPIKKNELANAIHKFETFSKKMFFNRNKVIDVGELLKAVTEAKPRYRTRFLVVQGEVFFPLPVEEIAFIFSRHRITSAVTFGGKRQVIDFTLDSLEEQLDPEMFFRANRHFIVNTKAVFKIHTFFNGKLLLETRPSFDEKLTISREKAQRFKQWLDH